MDYREKSEIRDGMQIDWDMPITMDDGLVLRCDIYRPIGDGKHPVIMTYGPYGKWLHFEDLYTDQWRRMCADHPDVPTGSTNKYQCWEVVDPEKWVPDGYVCIRVDSRGAGRSPGVIDIWSLREAQDLAQCVDWAGVQPWSNGKVGLNGISYYAENQWQTAALQPKHLAAICTWEGAADFYRDMAHHGGIFCRGFVQDWSKAQVYTVQNGRGTRGFKSRMNGDRVSGPETLSEEVLGQNRRDFYEDCISRKLDTDPYWQSRMPDWSKVKTPLLSSANWGGQGLHPRGNFEGFVRAASEQKWLECHGIEHWTHFYTNYGLQLQKKFFGHFLKGEDHGWDKQPKVLLQVRHPGERFVERHEGEWPLARTNWTKFYLHPGDMMMSSARQKTASSVTYAGLGDGVTFPSPDRSTRSMSRSGRPASCCRRAAAWRSPCAAPTTSFPASPAPAWRRWARSGPASAPSPTTTHATVRRQSSAGTSRCTPAPIAQPMCCCRSFPRSKCELPSHQRSTLFRSKKP
jgi:putative CocE/NonD family hydrolase